MQDPTAAKTLSPPVLERLLAELPNAVLVTTLEGVITYANDAAAELLGMPAQRAVGRSIESFLRRPEHQLRIAQLREQVKRTGSWSGELVLDEGDEGTIVCRANCSMLKDEDGRPMALVGVVEQLTRENRTERALLDALEQFRALADCVPALVTISWSDGRPRWFNEAFFEYTGATYDELVAAGWRSFVHLEDFERVPPPTYRTPWEAEFRLRRHDGEYRWMSARTANVRNARGETIGFVGVAFDVHELHLAEEQAQEARRQLEAIYQSAPTGLAVVDADRRFVRVNQTLADWNGRSVDDHIGRRVDELFGTSPRVEAALSRVLDHGETVLGLDLYGATPGTNGEKRHWLENWVPLKDAEGNVRGASVSVEDVTDRTRAEVREREAKEHFEAMLDALPESVVVLGEGSIVTFNNRRWIEATGIDLRGHHLRDLLGRLHPDDMEASRLAWRSALRARQPMESTFRMLQADGSYRWQLARGAPIVDQHGAESRYIGSIIDVDEQKHSERALESAARIKDQFLGMVSHELRAPLTTLLGLSEMLRHRVDDLDRESRDEALGQLFDDAVRLNQLIDDMLVLSRAAQSTSDLEPVLLQRTIPPIFALEAQQHLSVRWEIDLPRGLPPVLGKEGWIEQVVKNLSSNAIKYGGSNSTVRVQGREAGRFVDLCVMDEGPGISPKDVERLFEPFYRGEAARQKPGLGLGLAVCERLVTLMNGTIAAASRPGGGTVVTVRLPVAPGRGARRG